MITIENIIDALWGEYPPGTFQLDTHYSPTAHEHTLTVYHKGKVCAETVIRNVELGHFELFQPIYDQLISDMETAIGWNDNKYRLIPKEVDAVPYEEGMEDGFVCYDLNGKLLGYYDKDGPLPRSQRIPAIKTLEGFHEISDGDWIITGVKGERYPCKPDVFEMTYEKVIKNGC